MVLIDPKEEAVQEAALLRCTDFVIPLKAAGVITRAVVEGVCSLYRPKSIVFIAEPDVLETLKVMSKCWAFSANTTRRFVDEDNLFSPLGLSKSALVEAFNPGLPTQPLPGNANPTEPREFGWWYQQLIKIGVGLMDPLISETYVVWDGDLIPIRRWPLFARQTVNGPLIPTVAILQSASKTTSLFAEYAEALNRLVGIQPAIPENGGTFITHHMIFSRHILADLVESIQARVGFDRNLAWPLLIIEQSHYTTRFSEYLSYFSFVQSGNNGVHSKELAYHALALYGRGGQRFRGGGEFMSAFANSMAPGVFGYSYKELLDFCRGFFGNGPAYVQLDHVYADPSVSTPRVGVHDVIGREALVSMPGKPPSCLAWETDLVSTPGDVFICTFPKTGTTLLQYICHLLRMGLAAIKDGSALAFADIHHVVPHTSSAWFSAQDLNAPQPNASSGVRLFKSHRRLQQVQSHVAYPPKFICAIRNPDETLVSMFKFRQNRGQLPPDSTVDEFARSHMWSESYSPGIIDTLFQFTRNLWDARDCPNILIVPYEALRDDTRRAWIPVIANFMNVSCCSELVEQIIAMTGRQAMLNDISKFDESVITAERVALGRLHQNIPLHAAKVTQGHSLRLSEDTKALNRVLWDEAFDGAGMPRSYNEFACGLSRRAAEVLEHKCSWMEKQQHQTVWAETEPLSVIVSGVGESIPLHHRGVWLRCLDG